MEYTNKRKQHITNKKWKQFQMKMVYFCNFALRWIQSPFDSLNILCDFVWLTTINFINEYMSGFVCLSLPHAYFFFFLFRDEFSAHKWKFSSDTLPLDSTITTLNLLMYTHCCNVRIWILLNVTIYIKMLWSPNGLSVYF